MADNLGSAADFEIYKKPYAKMSFYALNVLIRMSVVSAMTISCITIGISTLDIGFDFKSIVLASLAASAVCSVMYFNLFAAFAVVWGVLYCVFRYICENAESIKLGALSFMNMGYEVVRNSLGLPYADGFNEVAGLDLSNEIRIIILLATIVLSVIISFFVGRYMSAVFAAILMLMAVCYCFFLENVKSYGSVAVIILCFLAVLYLKLAGFGKIIGSKKFNKRRLVYRLAKPDGVFMAEITAGIFALSIAVFCVISGVFGKNTFDNDIKKMNINNYIKYTIKDVMVLKYAQYKRFEIPETVDYGQLGFYSCVKPKVQTALTITTEPIDEDKLFLREFIGADYNYRENSWTSKNAASNIAMTNLTADALKNSNAEKSTIEFEVHGSKGFSEHIYVPYYSSVDDQSVYNYIDECNIKGTSEKKYSAAVYEDNGVTVNDEEYKKYVYDNYTYIAPENRQVIDEILNKININKDSENIEAAIKQYFNDGYAYEFDNDVVPFGRDFVNYFLTETKQGSFAHFASAAVLMYRSMGIPARYAGGYAVDNEQILAGKYKDGKFKVNVSRANMYAWAEVYEDGFGWRYVDVSPSPKFMKIAEKYDNKNQDGTENSAAENHKNILEEYFKPIENEYYNPMHLGKNILILLALLLIFAFALFFISLAAKFMGIYIIWLIKYNKSSDDVKAYMLMEKLRKKLKLSKDKDYTQFAEAAVKNGMSKEKAQELSDIANKLVFGRGSKSDEVKRLKNLIRRINKGF